MFLAVLLICEMSFGILAIVLKDKGWVSLNNTINKKSLLIFYLYIRSKNKQPMDYDHLLHTIVKILTNRISLIGFKKIGSNVVVLRVPKTGIVIIISIVHHKRLGAVKLVEFHFHVVNDSHMKLLKINNVVIKSGRKVT